MARIVFLDSGPLGLLTRAHGIPAADRCRAWLWDLLGAGVVVVAPAIADFEVRRELIRLGATAALRRLDELAEDAVVYEPLSDPALRRAAELWALVRNAGTPTAPPEALDGIASWRRKPRSPSSPTTC
jgi:hypothetical protein